MKHKTRQRYEVPGQIRFLTFSCYRQLPLFNNDSTKDIFVQRLANLRDQNSMKVIAWVIMPEHVHLLLQPTSDKYPIPKILSSLKRPVAQRVLHHWRKINATKVLERITTPQGNHRFWQAGGGYDRNIFSQEEMKEKIDYIHQNPVRRGLVKKAIDWKWSSARWYAGDRSNAVLIDMVW